MKKLLIAFGLSLLLVGLNGTSLHAATYEQIIRFDSRITIKPSNTVVIVETINYDFGDSYHHGIYRDVPIDYKDGDANYYLNFKLNGVWDETGESLETKLSTENGNKRIRIGYPDRTITGLHGYKISYELSPVITQRGTDAFVNLDVIGEGWQVPINNITASVALENGAKLSDITWYGATNESTEPTKLSVANLNPYQGVTINATLPNNYVSSYLQPNVQRSEDVIASIISIAIGSAIGLIVSGIVIILIARAVRTHRRRKSQIVVAQYEPPVGMTPGQIGLLEDDEASGREITATIIDWAVRGYLKITYIEKKGLFGTKDYQLTSLKSPDDLPYAEKELFNAFFTGKDETDSVRISDLAHQAVATQSNYFKTALKQELTNKGYYDKTGQLFMRGTLTEDGAKQWALVDGFKLYLSVVEKDRLKFSDAPDKTPERFNALLPYAIALGVEKEWAKQFEGIDLAQSTTWYSGNLAAFSAVTIASDLGNSFASTVSSNSSVSSSGGSSGGGFGGGGGGSW